MKKLVLMASLMVALMVQGCSDVPQFIEEQVADWERFR